MVNFVSIERYPTERNTNFLISCEERRHEMENIMEHSLPFKLLDSFNFSGMWQPDMWSIKYLFNHLSHNWFNSYSPVFPLYYFSSVSFISLCCLLASSLWFQGILILYDILKLKTEIKSYLIVIWETYMK